jgi:hypothetical protein
MPKLLGPRVDFILFIFEKFGEGKERMNEKDKLYILQMYFELGLFSYCHTFINDGLWPADMKQQMRDYSNIGICAREADGELAQD